jgi:UDP-glucose 4-epimerase
MDLSGSRILVTGGCGLIGSTTIDLLLRDHAPERIVIFDNLSRGTLRNVEAALRDPRVELARGDIRDVDATRSAMRDTDLVVHMADVFPTSEEHHPYNNRTWYGATKVMLEGLLRSFNDMYGLPYVALRYFNVYGPRMDLHGKYTEVLIRWMDRIAAGQPPLILGDGATSMDFVYVEDVARANILALQSDLGDEVFNVASGVETSLNQLADALLRVMGSTLKPAYGPERSVNPVSRRLADTRKAERLLGFRASIDLDEGLRRLVKWWQASREAVA